MYKQRVEYNDPPILDLIVKTFPWAAKKGVLFSFGPVLYNPSKVELTPMLIAHEAVHGERQVSLHKTMSMDPVSSWWEEYLDNDTFRLEEELLAHKAELLEAKRWLNRHNYRGYAVQVARRLSSPLYGNMLTYADAKELLR